MKMMTKYYSITACIKRNSSLLIVKKKCIYYLLQNMLSQSSNVIQRNSLISMDYMEVWKLK